MATSSRSRQEEDTALVLHTYPYSETSLIVEVFTRHFGRIGLLAKGAKRPRSVLRGTLHAFQPLTIAWLGKNDLRTLASADWQAALPQLTGIGLICGFYLNELILKLLRRDDPHEKLFDYYMEAIIQLRQIKMEGQHNASINPLLRRFELHLLRELGYAVSLDYDADLGTQIIASKSYEYINDHGPVVAKPNSTRFKFSGQTLIDMAQNNYSNPTVLIESKQIMRQLISHYLDDQPLHTRQLIKDLKEIV